MTNGLIGDTLDDAGTRYKLTWYMLLAVIGIVVLVMVLSAFNVAIPEFVSGVVIMGFMGMLKDAYYNYFKAREDQQIANQVIATKAAESNCTETNIK
jgi:hypothetical protein